MRTRGQTEWRRRMSENPSGWEKIWGSSISTVYPIYFNNFEDFQVKTLEYDFKKCLNVKKSFEDRLKQTNTDKELFADVDQQLERQNKDFDYLKKLEKDALVDPPLDSDSDEMCFEKLLEKSQKRNSSVVYE